VVDGRPLVFASCPAIARDGTIYFTQSSQRHDLDHYATDVLEHSGTGRILRHRDGRTEVIAEGLQFANGIVLTADESVLIVSETSAYRLGRHELDGSGRIGGTSTLIDALPGFPDNLTSGRDGLIWIGMVRPRDRLLDALLPRPARLRAFVSALPEPLLPGPKNIAWALAVNQAGTVVHDLRGWHVGFREVTAARHVGNRLYLGSLDQSAIAALELP
jgi:sugar lactone lactonase YvrE